MQLTGKLIAALPAKSGVSKRTGNPWKSKDYILEIPGQYPKKMCFEVFGEERLKQFNLRKDEEITVYFDIDANENNGRWYNKISAYKVERTSVQPQPTSNTGAAQTSVASEQSDQGGDGSFDDVPF